jgi:outer membrane lipoprotein-sorting protein
MKRINLSNPVTYLLSAVFSLALASLPASAQSPSISWDLDDALKQINRQADDFDTALARVSLLRKNMSGETLGEQSATIFFNSDRKVRIDMDAPDQRTLLLDSKYLYIHHPERKIVEQYYLSKHPDRLEPFVRLGFSRTGKELKNGFLLTSLGERDIGTSRTLGLDLTPQKGKNRELISRVQLWIDQASWMPTQQVIEATQARETLILTYTHTARNLPLNPELFKARWPKGTKKQKM